MSLTEQRKYVGLDPIVSPRPIAGTVMVPPIEITSDAALTSTEATRWALLDAKLELDGARARFAPFNSAHEAWAVLFEEVDKLWDEVKIKQGSRDVAKMRKEAVQAAAMALRFIVDICDGGRGQK